MWQVVQSSNWVVIKSDFWEHDVIGLSDWLCAQSAVIWMENMKPSARNDTNQDENIKDLSFPE